MANISRKNSINKSLKQYGQNIVKNYNKRVRYYAKKGQDAPKPVKWSDIVTYYGGNTKAMRSRLKDLAQYNHKNATELVKVGKYGININKYRYEKFTQNSPHALNKIEKEIIKSSQRDKREGFRLPSERTRGLMARKETIEYGSKSTATKKQVQAAMKYVNYYTEQRIQMDEQFYRNFMQMFETQANLAGVPREVIKELENNFKQLPPDDLLEMFENEPDVKQVVNNYNLTKETDGKYLTKKEKKEEYKKFITLKEYLPTIIEKYKNK